MTLISKFRMGLKFSVETEINVVCCNTFVRQHLKQSEALLKWLRSENVKVKV